MCKTLALTARELKRTIVTVDELHHVCNVMSDLVASITDTGVLSYFAVLLPESFPFGCTEDVAIAGIAHWLSDGFEAIRERWACDFSPDLITAFEQDVATFLEQFGNAPRLCTH